MAEGVDYAGDRPDPRQLAAAGKTFVVRYGGPGGAWKHIDAAEAAALAAAGLAIVANAEGAADGLRGRDAGVSWARDAEQHFRALGMPAGRPIYLSADWDVTAAQWPQVADALRGAASVLGAARVGVYGGYRAVTWARRDGVARWFWQTYAWSSGRWAEGNHIEQYRNGVALAGGTVDLNRSLTGDFGQWGGEDDDMTPEQSRQLHNLNCLLSALLADADTVTGLILPSGQLISQTLQLSKRVRQLEARPTVDLTDAQLTTIAERVAAILAPQQERAAEQGAEAALERARIVVPDEV